MTELMAWLFALSGWAVALATLWLTQRNNAAWAAHVEELNARWEQFCRARFEAWMAHSTAQGEMYLAAMRDALATARTEET